MIRKVAPEEMAEVTAGVEAGVAPEEMVAQGVGPRRPASRQYRRPPRVTPKRLLRCFLWSSRSRWRVRVAFGARALVVLHDDDPDDVEVECEACGATVTDLRNLGSLLGCPGSPVLRDVRDRWQRLTRTVRMARNHRALSPAWPHAWGPLA